jgi:hypothetical protein
MTWARYFTERVGILAEMTAIHNGIRDIALVEYDVDNVAGLHAALNALEGRLNAAERRAQTNHRFLVAMQLQHAGLPEDLAIHATEFGNDVHQWFRNFLIANRQSVVITRQLLDEVEDIQGNAGPRLIAALAAIPTPPP